MVRYSLQNSLSSSPRPPSSLLHFHQTRIEAPIQWQTCHCFIFLIDRILLNDSSQFEAWSLLFKIYVSCRFYKNFVTKRAKTLLWTIYNASKNYWRLYLVSYLSTFKSFICISPKKYFDKLLQKIAGWERERERGRDMNWQSVSSAPNCLCFSHILRKPEP